MAKKAKKPKRKKLKSAVRKSKRRAPLIQPAGGMNHC